MVVIMKVSSVRMRSVDLEITIGLMVSLILATGPKTKWTDRVSLHGRMAKNMKEIL